LTMEDFSVIREIKNATNERHLWSCFMWPIPKSREETWKWV
jgi:hypothetical protein